MLLLDWQEFDLIDLYQAQLQTRPIPLAAGHFGLNALGGLAQDQAYNEGARSEPDGDQDLQQNGKLISLHWIGSG